MLLVAAAGGLAWASVGRPDPPPATIPTAPDCLHVQGEELAVNDRWRVVHTGDGGEYGNDYSPTPVIACDVRQRGSARVRLLGMAKLTGGGEDYAVEEGPYVLGGRIGGDLVLIDSRFYDQLGNEGGSKETGFTTLYDLRRGASMRLPGDWLDRSTARGTTLTAHALHAYLTPSGGLTTVYGTKDGRKAPLSFGPITAWDATGRRTLPQHVDRIAVAGRDRRAGDDGGLYFRASGGVAGRVGLRGAATTSALKVDPDLAWRRMELDSYVEQPDPPEDELLPMTYQLLPPARDGNDGGLDGSLWLRYSPSDRARNRTVRIMTTYSGGGPVLARLAKGSDDELRTLTSNGDIAIVTGRFEERPAERRVRMVGPFASDGAKAFFDLPATRALRRHGRALIRAEQGVGVGTGAVDLYALTDGDHLWLWGATGGHVYDVPGLHDVVADVGRGGVFGTDGRGVARYFAA